MIKGHPQTDGGALFCTRLVGTVRPRWVRVVGRIAYAPTGTRQTWLASLMPVCDTPLPENTPFMYPANFAAPAGALSALLSDSIFAAVFGDAKSDGPVRDVKRESSERLEQCPLL